MPIPGGAGSGGALQGGKAGSYQAAVAQLYGLEPWDVITDVRRAQSPGRLGPQEDDGEVLLINPGQSDPAWRRYSW